MHVKLIFRLILILFCSLLVFTGSAQDKGPGITEENSRHPYISWVSQYPAHKEGEVKQSTAKRIYDFLVQKNKQATLSRPVSVIGNNPGSFWVLDQGDETIGEIKKNKLEIPKSIKKKANYFTSLVSECILPDGSILFTDSRLNKVFLLDIASKKASPINDTLQLQQPTGVAYSAATNEIWITETGAHRITVLSRSGELKRRIGRRGSENGEFNFPTSIWIDKAGDAYVVDAMNFRVEIFNKNGEFVSTFGEAGDATGNFARPKGIATDTYGNIYVADALFHVVQIFDRTGNFLYSFGRQGREKGEFWMPAGIYIDSKNYIYVADSYNSRIQIFQLINGG
jgi:DNA-binding beta-propeller fold protein YncE